MTINPRDIEVPDGATVAMYRKLSGAQKLHIVNGMFRSATQMVRAGVRTEHPHWSPEQVSRETALRITRDTDQSPPNRDSRRAHSRGISPEV